MASTLSQYATLAKGDHAATFVPQAWAVNRVPAALPGPVVATRGAYYEQLVGLDITADAGRCCRLRQVALQKITDAQFVYHNWHNNEAVPDGPIKVRSSFEPALGTYVKVFFPGGDTNRDVLIPPGGFVVSYPFAMNLAAAATFWTNSLVVPTGTQYPVGKTGYSGGSSVGVGDGIIVGATDYTSAANPNKDNVNQLPAYGPLAIIGTIAGVTRRQVVIPLVGDSQLVGFGDSSNNGAPDKGTAMKRLQAAGIGYINVAMPGQGAVTWITGENSRRRRALLSSGYGTVFCNYGTNDLAAVASATALEANISTIAQQVIDAGLRFMPWTVTPRTNGGNTAAASAAFGPEGGSGSERTKYNTWLRANFGADVVDIAPAVEQYSAGIDTYLWKTGYTGDGVHQNSTGYTATNSIIDAAIARAILLAA